MDQLGNFSNSMKRFYIVLFVFMCLSVLPVTGSKIVIQNFIENYGLPRNFVNCMCMFQDSKGFLWFGMANGLYKFDLNSFTYFSLQKNKINGFPESDIRAITEYIPGMLLIGTYNKGLLIYNTITERYDSVFCDSPIDFSKLYIHSIYIDRTGIIWIGSYNGLFRLKYSETQKNKFEFLDWFNSNNTSMVGDEIVGITESETGDIWFITVSDIGCYYSDSNKIRTYPMYGANSSFTIIDNKRILIGCYGEGLKIFNIESFTVEDFRINGLGEKPQIRYVFKDSQSNIWLSISNVGLMLLENDLEDPVVTLISNKYPEYAAMNSNVIYQICESRDGALWVCNEAGVNMIYLRKEWFKSYICNNPEDPTEIATGVRAMLNSGDGFIWTGTIGGSLKHFNLAAEKFQDVSLISDGKKIGKNIQAILRDHTGNIWLGTEGEGVIRFVSDQNHTPKNETIINYRIYPNSFPEKSLLNDYVMCLLEDKNMNIWIGTWYGLSLIEASELEKPDQSKAIIRNFLNIPSNDSSISNDIIMSLLEDKSGNIWVGTQEGINKIIKTSNGYRFKHNYKNESGTLLSEKKILSIYQSKNGTLWFSTQDGGIAILDTQTGIFKEYNSENGFHDNIVNSIAEADGNLWLGTNNGLCRFNPESRSFNMYSTEDGLITENFFFGASCVVNNVLFFGGSSGITAFNPKNIEPEHFKANLVFTDLWLFNKRVTINNNNSPLKKHISNVRSIVFNHNQNFITIAFAALNYKQYQEVQYSCMMEGLETSWNNLGKEHKVTYTNLLPGNYIFKVKAFNSNDHSNPIQTSLKLQVKPPIWKTSLAYLIYLVLFTLILIQIYRFILTREQQKNALALERINAKRIHEMDLMKLQFFTNISHEFRTPLTLISAPLESLIKEHPNNSKAQKYYQVMLKNIQRLKRLIDQLLDLRKVEEGFLKMEWDRGDIIDFIQKIFNIFQNYSEKRNIYFTFQSSVPQLNTFFDADKLDKVLFNLLSNAFKYTPDYGSIALKLNLKDPTMMPYQGLTESYLEIKVTDSGFGIPKELKEKLFHPFQKLNTNKPIDSATTGIGLALTKELISLHKGYISVESEENKGSIFTVYLPIYECNPQPHQQRSTESKVDIQTRVNEDIYTSEIVESDTKPSGLKPLILIVEDDPDLRAFLKSELQDLYRVVESGNGQDGLRQAITKIPDLIISDIMMDKINGVELCNKIKLDERTSHIPVILLTARHSEEIKIMGYKIGADDYITKPFNIALLNTRIRNLIEQRRKLRKNFGTGNNFNLYSTAVNNIDSQFMDKLNQVIEKNIANPNFNPTMLSSAMALSRMQLYRKVSALTNQTVYNLIRSIRLNRAAQLLVTTDMQIAEIALSVGFSEPSNFTKSFTRLFKKTPSQFARLNRK